MDNTTLPGGGDAIRDIDRSLNVVPGTAKTQVTQLDAGGESQESLVAPGNPLPTQDQYSTLQNDVLMKILVELRVMSLLLQQGLSTKDDLDQMREDAIKSMQIGQGADGLTY